MAPQISRGRVSIVVLLASLVLPLLFPECYSSSVFIASAAAPESDVDLLEFPLNLEYLEAEFFLFGSLGHGLDVVAPNLIEGGPPPIGVRLARLGSLVRNIIFTYAFLALSYCWLLSFFFLVRFYLIYLFILKFAGS